MSEGLEVIEGAYINIPTAASNHVVSVIEWFPHVYWNPQQCIVSALDLPKIASAPLDQLVIFTFVQNPFQRLVDAWRKHAPQQRFTEFVNDMINGKLIGEAVKDTCKQHPYVTNSPNCHGVFVFKCESLKEDFEIVKGILNIPENVTFLSPDVQTTCAKNDYRQIYDEDTRAKVQTYYQQDLSRFGYSF